MKLSAKETKALEIQEFRFSIISEIVNPYLQRGDIEQMIREKANRSYVIPYSGRTSLSRACIKKWYLKFKKYGKPGLLPKSRSDSGKSRALTEQEQAAIIKQLEQKPNISPTTAIRDLQRKGIICKSVASSTLSRFIQASGLDKPNRKKAADQELTHKFAFFAPLECVQADCMHAFAVPDEKGKKRKAILLSFIDDATRRIIYANFAFTENALEFDKGIKHILKAHGRIGALYCDNGATFVSNQTRRILDILGIPLFHSTPGRPQGKGKKERFYRTVREQFLSPLDQEDIRSLADLNARFKTWLESEYHRSPHSGLQNQTPLDTWLSKASYIIPVDPTINLDDIFMHEIMRKVYKDNTFTLNGTIFEVPVPLAGITIKVRYNPHTPVIHPQVFHEGKLQGVARIVDTYANAKVRRNIIHHGSVQSIESSDSCKQNEQGFSSTQASLTASGFQMREAGDE